MMDLTKKSLPNIVTINGRDFSIHTDFRLWLKFVIEDSDTPSDKAIDIRYLFKNDFPPLCMRSDLYEFAHPINELPRRIPSERNEIMLDFRIDADAIYSSFYTQYGIDLFAVGELHWHKFLALLNGLNDGTKLREIMMFRSYNPNRSKNENTQEKLYYAWRIEPKLSEQEQKELDEFNRKFGGGVD